MNHAQIDPALEEIAARLASHDPASKRQAAEELLESAASAAGFAPQVLPLIADPDERVRESIVGWLENAGAPASEDVAAIAPHLQSKSADVTYWAITLLGRLGPDSETAVPQLIRLLADGNPLTVRERAAWAIGRIGPRASAARAVLAELTTCQSPRLGRLAAEALREIV